MMKTTECIKKEIMKKVAGIKCLIILLTIIPYATDAQMVTERIKLNQVGFYPAALKMAIVTGSTPATQFYITSTNSRDTFFTGALSTEQASQHSSTVTKKCDFSAFTKKGSYLVQVPGVGHSYVFQIGDSIHREVAIASLKGFYYQRVSMPLLPQFAGRWHRGGGHPDQVVLIHPSAASKQRPAGTVVSSPGGWYDAGDYNKYIVNSGITMGTLLSAYEDFEKHFRTLLINIPESGDAVPDVLNEVAYNLRWMLTMQDGNDGGVYHKCTNADFDAMVMPGITIAPRYLVQKGTAAALDFAAVTAQAARVYKPFEKIFPGLADSCLKAAEMAWQWAQQNPKVEYNQPEINKTFQPQITTGAYGDKKFSDEWFWAASELLVTTGRKGYGDTVQSRIKDSVSIPSWANVQMLGCYTLLRHQKGLAGNVKGFLPQLKAKVLQLADVQIANVAKSAFATVMGQTSRDFVWGSSSVAANQSILLINAYLQTGNQKYLVHAVSNLDYLLGRNATGYSFVTGAGSKPIMHPHHRPSVADGITEPLPGLLSGGPNPGMQDKCKYEFTEPETAFTDHDCSYASNEIAINWNAPLVYLANAIEALQGAFKMNNGK